MRAACATFGVSLFRSRCFLFFGPVFSSLLVSTVFFTARGWANEAASEVLVRASLLGPGLACRLLHSYQCKQSSRHKAPAQAQVLLQPLVLVLVLELWKTTGCG